VNVVSCPRCGYSDALDVEVEMPVKKAEKKKGKGK